MGINVTLRTKPLGKDRLSLYLDFYPAVPHHKTGKLSRRQFLGLHIDQQPKTSLARTRNKDLMLMAEQIRIKRENELNKPEIYTEFEKSQLAQKAKGEQDFIAFFWALAKKRGNQNYQKWISTLNYLQAYAGDHLQFNEVDESFCDSFRYFLLETKCLRRPSKKLNPNSASAYFLLFKFVLKEAYKAGYFTSPLDPKIENIKLQETHRQFLSLSELNALARTPMEDKMLKKASLFSALTGLRYSDIEKLLWSELEYVEGQGYYLNFEQRKTKGFEFLPISEQAASLLGKRKFGERRVFPLLSYKMFNRKEYKNWLANAGIIKHITFHCFRHTFATLQLASGTDIYTVSKMLGHRELKTTQIYAKVIDESKRKAADRIHLEM